MNETIVKLKQALQAARDKEDHAAETRILSDLGAVVTRPGGGQEALRHLQQAETLAQQLHDQKLLAEIMNNKGRAYMADGLVREALAAYETAVDLAQQINADHIELTALRALTYANRQFVSADRALSYARLGVTIAAKVDDAETQGELQLIAANLLGDMDMFEEALEGFQQAITIFELAGLRYQLAQATGNLAMTYARMNQTAPARDLFEQAMFTFKDLGKTADMVQADTYRQAIDDGQVAQFVPGPLANLREAREAGVPERILNALDDIMAYHVDQSHMGSVIRYAHQKIAVARQVTDAASECDAFADLGTAHMALGEVVEAIEAQQQALALAQSVNDEQRVLNAMLGLLDAQQKLNVEDAITVGRAAVEQAITLGDTETAMHVSGVLGVLYEEQGDVDNAAQQLAAAADRAERIGETGRQATYLFNLGMMLYDSGQDSQQQLEAARALFKSLAQPDIVARIDQVLGTTAD